MCDYEKLLPQNVHQYAVFPIARMPAIIPLRATVRTLGRRLPTPGLGHIYIQPQIRKSWDSMENANKKRK